MAKNRLSGKEHPLNLFFADSLENVRTHIRASSERTNGTRPAMNKKGKRKLPCIIILHKG